MNLENWPELSQSIFLLSCVLLFIFLYVVTTSSWITYKKYNKKILDLIMFVIFSVLMLLMAYVVTTTTIKLLQ